MSAALMLASAPVGDNPPAIALAPRAWRDTRWVGQVSGQTTTHDVLAGAWVSPEARRAVSRAYAVACADLAQATLGGFPPHSADWDRWFGALRTAARELSPTRAGAHVVRRALHHGGRLEEEDALWAHRLRRGFAALLAASLPEPVPALIGEDLAAFHAHDAAWLAQDAPAQDGAVRASSHPIHSGATVRTRWGPLFVTHRAGALAHRPPPTAPTQPARRVEGSRRRRTCCLNPGSHRAGRHPATAAGHAGWHRCRRPPPAGRRSPRWPGGRPGAGAAAAATEQLQLQLVENLQRADLTPIQEGRAYQHLVDTGATLASIARAVGVSASRVRERPALLDLDASVQEQVHRGELPLNVAALLRPVHDPAHQRRLARLAVRRRLSMAQVRHLVEAELALPPVASAPLPSDDEPNGGGLSPTREAVLEALRAQPERWVTCSELASLAEHTCSACGLASAPVICAECPLLATLRAVLRQRDSRAG